MDFMQIGGFTVKPGKLTEFQRWVEAHLDSLKRTYPAGTSLVGVYVTVFSSEKGAGDVWMIERVDSYGALDRLAALGKDTDSEYSRLANEMMSFVDISLAAPYSNTLLKNIVDATVWSATAGTAAELVPAGA